MLSCSIPMDIDFALFFVLHLCHARFIPPSQCTLGATNKRHKTLLSLVSGSESLRLVFAVYRIHGQPLISAFKQRFWVCIVLYPVSDKSPLKDKLITRTYRLCIQLKIDKQVTHAIGQGSTLNLRICEHCVGRTFSYLEVNWMSTVRALSEHCMSIVWALKYLN